MAASIVSAPISNRTEPNRTEPNRTEPNRTEPNRTEPNRTEERAVEKVKLPVISNAASTAFCAERLDGPGGFHIFIDGNAKITADNGTYESPKPNAFSLVEIRDCPGSTPTCRSSCYVQGIRMFASDVHAMYRHNSRTIREILASPRPIPGEWAMFVAKWVETNARGGFRWHVSGDIFSMEYAYWISLVVKMSPNVRHWIYTRSFELGANFVGLDNITVNFSADRDNYERARPYVEAHRAAGSPVRLCYLVTEDGKVPSDLPEGSVLFPDYALRGARSAPAEQRASSSWYQSLKPHQRRMVCPVDFYSKAENRRCGPCSKCIDPPVAVPYAGQS